MCRWVAEGTATKTPDIFRRVVPFLSCAKPMSSQWVVKRQIAGRRACLASPNMEMHLTADALQFCSSTSFLVICALRHTHGCEYEAAMCLATLCYNSSSLARRRAQDTYISIYTIRGGLALPVSYEHSSTDPVAPPPDTSPRTTSGPASDRPSEPCLISRPPFAAGCMVERQTAYIRLVCAARRAAWSGCRRS
ncbi:unnamed protein product [Mycena citricolor]|uniref:Uncharacterized protein n=1 Tax=Mycena citricolor TaxID=2018698 RepID=A0AAD2H0L7_9AGAR|nr:unnamed protein product [Mycena citricolor]